MASCFTLRSAIHLEFELTVQHPWSVVVSIQSQLCVSVLCCLSCSTKLCVYSSTNNKPSTKHFCIVSLEIRNVHLSILFFFWRDVLPALLLILNGKTILPMYTRAPVGIVNHVAWLSLECLFLFVPTGRIVTYRREGHPSLTWWNNSLTVFSSWFNWVRGDL